ncbi:cytochrome c [Cytophagaceae bacterium ABcell3]|nr:cytochrome c [Cytophagaceae bacterium ABcell3]
MESFKKALILFTVIGLWQACAPRKSEPIASPLEIKSEEVLEGQKLFMHYCHKCHPHGEAGLGTAINNNPSPQFMKRFQVRHGLGVMPSFDTEKISREELRNISAYLRALQRN